MTQAPWHPHEDYDIRGNGVRWDDLKFPFTQIKIGALDKPDFDFTNIGLLFPQNDATEIIYIIGQLPHARQLGSPLKPHIHWRQSANTPVKWVLEYKICNNGEVPPVSFTKLESTETTFDYVEGITQITPLGTIDGANIALSSILLMKVYRDDNTTTGDVLGYEMDIHYQIDSRGSRREFVK